MNPCLPSVRASPIDSEDSDFFIPFGFANDQLQAAVGIYGLVAYSVTQRTNEIGIRMALGATAGSVLRMVLRQGTWLIAVGLGLGLAASSGLTRFLQAQLWGVTPTDTDTFIVISVILAATALAACVVPARRASRVDPMVALRHE